VLTSDLPPISQTITIRAPNPGQIINGNSQFRVFATYQGSLTLNNIMIANAVAQGGQGADGTQFSAARGGGWALVAPLKPHTLKDTIFVDKEMFYCCKSMKDYHYNKNPCNSLMNLEKLFRESMIFTSPVRKLPAKKSDAIFTE
jgi:hypothetical protein